MSGLGRSYYAVGPLVSAPEVTHDDSNTNHLPYAPAEVDVGSQITPKGYRTDLGGIRNSKRLEDAPGNTAQDLGDLEVHDGLGREEDGRKGDDEHEAENDSIAISKPFGDISVY